KTVKQLEKLDRAAQKKIVLAVTKLADNPRPHSVKSLVNRPGEYRIRVGDYRVVYEIHDGQLLVLVVAVAHRSEAYRIP
ncbi:MAG: type II toxin-antitoxin system RelE family toxin, partial [Pseudonocardiaceae bacterium]